MKNTKLQNPSLKKRKGFTLIELIVVIAILAILAAIAIPAFIGQLNRARISSHNANIATLRSAAAVAIAENGNPTTATEWTGVDNTVGSGFDPDKYIDEWPSLPTGLTYTATSGYAGTAGTTQYRVYIDTTGVITVNIQTIAMPS